MTATAQPAPSFTGAGIPLGRLVHVEARKLVDTRAGFWLTVAIGVISVLIGVIILIVGPTDPEPGFPNNISFEGMFNLMTAPMGFLLPVMAILLVTGEWSQRNALTTFVMEPRRERVIAAKLIVAVAASIVAVVIALIFGAICNLIGGVIYSDAGSWSFGGTDLAIGLLNILIGVVIGFAFAALFLNTPASIVAYFILPMVLGIVGSIIPWTRDHLLDWIMIPALPIDADGSDWAHFGVGTLLWFVIPIGFGISRIMRSEVK